MERVKNLFYKELRLALHPAAVMFLGLSALLLIPSYPFYITFFYTCLGIFFICLNGRETGDIAYTLLLPIPKRDAVKARFLLVTALELVQAVLAVPFLVLRNTVMIQPNEAGIDANLAFLGISFLLLGVFNLLFFTCYYRDPDKVGRAFFRGCAGFAAGMLLAEALVLAVPAVGARLDTPDPQFLAGKLVILLAGAVSYALLTIIAYRGSVRSFEALDL